MKKRRINKQKIFCFVSFVFILVCFFWYGGRAVYFYLDSRKTIENEDDLLAQIIINKDYGTDNFKKINGDYYFYDDADDNYLVYSNILWRVVKINSDNEITLVTDSAITNLAYGDDKSYTTSYINNWLNDMDTDNTGILEGNLNDYKDYLTKMDTCVDDVDDVADITCDDVNSDYYLGLLSIVDYVNTGANDGFINNGQYTYLANSMNSNVWYVDSNGSLDTSDGTDIYGVKTTISLKSTVTLVSGEGTSDSPYVIEEDTDYFGSYIQLGDDVWRVYNVSDDYLMLVLLDYLTVDGEVLEYGYSFSNYYHNDTVYGTLAYYLNNTYLDSLSYKDLIVSNEYFNYYYGDDTSYDYVDILNNTIETYVSIPSIGDVIFNDTLEDYFLNTGTSEDGSLIYIMKSTSKLSSTSVTNEKYVVPCITISKDSIMSGTGQESDPYRTE